MEKISDTLIMVFARNPIAGRVKTRIGSMLGDLVALQTYRRLCLHTRRVIEQVSVDRMLWLDGPQEGEWIWGDGLFRVSIQKGAGLGDRMSNAFRQAFDCGYRKVVIIGTDCPGLTPDLLKDAIEKLNDFPAVIGPATDGGYYLLGLTGHRPELFLEKAWGTGEVWSATVADLKRLGVPYCTMPELPDVDTPADLVHLQGIP